MTPRSKPVSAITIATWVGLSAVASLAGCSLSRLGHEEVDSVLQRYLDDAPAAGQQYSRLPGVFVDGEESSAVADSQNDSTLRDLLIVALRENPGIQAAEEDARAAAERIAQVTALPDPFLKTKTLPEPVRTAEGDNFFVLGISQKLPLPAKLNRAGRRALEETRIALEQLQETRLRVIADVKRAYFQLYMVIKTIEITRDNQDLLRGLIGVARAQVATGRRAQEDVLRAHVELSGLEAELIVLRQRRVTVVARLNALLDRPTATAVPAPADFGIRQADSSLKELLSKAAKINPELKRLERQIERERHGVELAKLAYWPDFSLGFEWMPMRPRDAFRPPRNPMTGQRPTVPTLSENGSDNWAITFGFSLPIWFDKIEAGIQEANRKLAATEHRYRSARNRVNFRIEDALERVRSQRALASIFIDTIIPQARQAYQVSRASYTAGTSDFLYVIDNWRKWLVFTIQYYRSLGELERSVADLEQAIGLSLAEAGAPR